MSGLSSGEGLIAEVRDPLDATDTAAPADKRLLVLKPEFAQVMKVLAREGNTLSPVVRNGWDGKRLQALVRKSPLRASEAHVGIVAHITKDELLRYLNATELANGFFNRSYSSPCAAACCCHSAAPSLPSTSTGSRPSSPERSPRPGPETS